MAYTTQFWKAMAQVRTSLTDRDPKLKQEEIDRIDEMILNSSISSLTIMGDRQYEDAIDVLVRLLCVDFELSEEARQLFEVFVSRFPMISLDKPNDLICQIYQKLEQMDEGHKAGFFRNLKLHGMYLFSRKSSGLDEFAAGLARMHVASEKETTLFLEMIYALTTYRENWGEYYSTVMSALLKDKDFSLIYWNALKLMYKESEEKMVTAIICSVDTSLDKPIRFIPGAEQEGRQILSVLMARWCNGSNGSTLDQRGIQLIATLTSATPRAQLLAVWKEFAFEAKEGNDAKRKLRILGKVFDASFPIAEDDKEALLVTDENFEILFPLVKLPQTNPN